MLHPCSTAPTLSRRSLVLMGLASGGLLACSSPVRASSPPVSVDIVDRESGEVLTVYRHRGRQYVAGRPGARYAIRLVNRTGGRVLAVAAVDGINIVTGQTAAWQQSGYVLAPWQHYDVTGWRKSDSQVAAFEFTALPDSYAARTGRPLDVGVIGVAVFQERQPPQVLLEPRPLATPRQPRAESDGPAGAARPAAPSSLAESAESTSRNGMADAARQARKALADDRLGTGHGVREASAVRQTRFERASSQPDDIVSLQYDRWDNLVAAGIVADRPLAQPRPFPHSPERTAYVPDPPRY